jgi:hypothetical protein
VTAGASPIKAEARRYGGTGSCPPRQNGWQRRIRQTAYALPRKIPCRSTASIAYWLQVGEKRHIGGFSGERKRR